MASNFYLQSTITGTALQLKLFTVAGTSLETIDFTLSYTTSTGTYVSTAVPTGWTPQINTSTPGSLLFSFADFSLANPVGVSADGLVATINLTLPTANTAFVGSLLITDASDVNANVVALPSAALNAGVAPCFAMGTRIATQDGELPVEQLVAGDVVRLARGGTAPVLWVGYRDVVCAGHPAPDDVNPVVIAAGAFGHGVPVRDLSLSPDHAVFRDGVLIPVRYLVNGATIRQVAVEAVAYFHVELAAHDLLLAEGLAAESFLDTGNRGAFANGGSVVMMYPDFAQRLWEARACAPLVTEGPVLEAVRSDLRLQAEQMGYGHTHDAELVLEAGGRTIRPVVEGKWLCFALPAVPQKLVLRSRVAIPAQVQDIGKGDTRTLGVAVAQMQIDGRAIDLRDVGLGAGWHLPETDWRWTDGAAELGTRRGRELRVALAMTETYWQAPAPLRQRHAG